MTDRFFKPMKKGQIYHSIDFEGMLQYIKEATPLEADFQKEINMICKVIQARALDSLFQSGLGVEILNPSELRR